MIAYSTMSQIGYMIMGASAGAYSAALFHLMTHAFFKALLFMAAGSIIGAMAGNQSLDRMSGFRKALPFTFLCFLVGGLALSGIPPFSGWFSKDEIIGYLNNRGGGFEVLGILGYLGALLTGLYTFRMIFRAFWGDASPEAQELEHGHLAHAEVPHQPDDRRGGGHRHRLPRPGARDSRAGVADANRDEHPRRAGADRRADPDSRRRPRDQQLPRAGPRRLAPGHARAQRGASSGSAWRSARSWDWPESPWPTGSRCWLRVPRAGSQGRFGWLHTFLVNKWYFDELIDYVVVRPSLLVGRVSDSVLERIVITGGVTGGVTGLVRAGSAAVRRAQTGFLRYYAAAIVLGLSALSLYFLISST